MNKILALLSCFIFVSGLAGCGRQNERMSNQPELADQTRQQASRGLWQGETYEQPLPDFFGDQPERNAFPDFLVGVWQVETGKHIWRIKFEPDGSIPEIMHPVVGGVNVAEGGVYLEGPDPGTFAICVMGPCEARYRPETRMLKLKIIVDYLMMKLPAGELEGRIEDYFEGPVSEDGKIWKVDWLNYRWIKNVAPPSFDLIEAHPEPLVFTKVDSKQQ